MSEQARTRVSKYLRVADDLRARIRSGEFPPGSRLPAETAIAKEHGTTVPTVREGMKVLRAEGLVQSRQGIGTFVRDLERFERRSRNRYGEARGRAGLLNNTFRHDIVFAGVAPAPAHVAPALGVEVGEPVVIRRRYLHDADDRLQEIGASYLPASFAAGTFLAEPTVVPKALFRCVEDLSGKQYAHAVDRWEARPATADELEGFDLPLGAHVMHVIHIATAGDRSALEVSESVWPADRVRLVDEYDIPSHAETPDLRSDI